VGQVIWSPQALDDVDAICVYIARDAPRYAEMFARGVFAATDRLADFPRSGRVVPELEREDYREIVFQSHRVVYRLQGEVVEVITVHHGARPLDESDVVR